MRRILLIIAFITAASAAFTQPVIDHMLIDEMKGQLSIFGTFSSVQGKVWVDSMEMPAISWTDTFVIASIPDSGKGSSGPVEIGIIGDISEKRIISVWNFSWEYDYVLKNTGGGEIQSRIVTAIIRFDLHSCLEKKRTSTISLLMNNKSILNAGGSSGPYHNGHTFGMEQSSAEAILPIRYANLYDSGFVSSVYFDLAKKIFNLSILNVKGIKGITTGWYLDDNNGGKVDYTDTSLYQVNDFNFDIPLDSMYEIVSSQIDTQNLSFSRSISIKGNKLLFPPPMSTFALQNDPSIIAPNNGSKNLGTDDAILMWDSLRLMDKYHLQLSLDSSFVSIVSKHPSPSATKIVIDTTVSSLQYALPPLEKNTTYYWRVAGVNSEGESRWSDIWHFTTGSSADVDGLSAQLQLYLFPNPASNELHVNYSLPRQEDVSIKIYDLLGREVRYMPLGVTDAGEHSIIFQTQGLSNDDYIFLLHSGQSTLRSVISITR